MIPIKAKFQVLFSVVFLTLAILVFPALSHFTQATREFFKKKEVNLVKEVKDGLTKRINDFMKDSEIDLAQKKL